MTSTRPRALVALMAGATLTLSGAAALGPTAASAAADGHTVTLVGSLQSELGCTADWQDGCAATALAPTGEPGRWSAVLELPAGEWEWRVAVAGAPVWTGADGSDSNTPLVLAGSVRVRVTYDEATRRTALALVDLPGHTAADDALVHAPVRVPGSDESFYFVMTDRFANGDPTNDTGGLAGGRLEHGYDPTDEGFYNGGDLAGLRENLDYVEGLGTTAIWLTPSFLNRPVQGTGAGASAGYHGYWITDFTQIDPHLGTNAELEALVDEAHARGIKVYFDIITNHTADVIRYAEGRQDYVSTEEQPYRAADGTPFDPADHAGTGSFPDLDPEVSFPYTPVVAPEDADVKVPAWLNDVTLYHNRGDSTWSGESVTYGDFVGLDDLMTEHPRVVEGFTQVYQDWVDLGIDGFRIDTAKHVDMAFWEQWTTDVLEYARAQGRDEFYMFGEVFDADAEKLAPYVRDTDMNGVLDFLFQSRASSFVTGGGPAALRELFAADDWYTTPTTNASGLPTFLGNHDMGRIGHDVRAADDPLDRSRLAHSLLYLTRGQPVVYYGDEQGFVGAGPRNGEDRDARQSLFASQVPQYVEQDLLTGERAGAVDRLDTDAPLYRHIAALAALRDATPALDTGAQLELAVSGPGEGSVYAFSRVHRDEKVEHVVALNDAGAPATVTVDTLTPGATFTSLLGGHPAVTAGADGTVELTVPARGAVALAADAPVAAGEPTLDVVAPTPGAAVAARQPVTADVVDDLWSETSFAVRVAGDDEWTPLGTAEDTAPGVVHDTSGMPRGALLEYRAVTTDAAGHRAAASTYGSVGVAVDGVVPDEPDPDDLVVAVPGSFNAEVGCTDDWQPACEQVRLASRGNGLYAATIEVPAGDWEYKVAVGGTWDENYGAGGVPGGGNVTFSLDAATDVTFVYDHATHAFTSSAEGPLLTLPGTFQSEVGCASDWDPACLSTVLLDGDADGVATFTAEVPAGSYEMKVAHGLGWAENYGEGGVRDGANITFTASGDEPLTFRYDLATHVLTVGAVDPSLPGTGTWQAHWLDGTTLAWPASLVPAGTDPADLTWRLHHSPDASLGVTDDGVVGGESVALTLGDGLTEEQLRRFPALDGYLALHLDAPRAAVEEWLTGELLVSAHDGDRTVAATGVQVPGVVDDLFAEDAVDRELGATYRTGRGHGTHRGRAVSLALWAPTAQDVDLLLWRDAEDPGGEPRRVQLERQADGTWTTDLGRRWYGAAYRYEVTVYAPTTDAVEVNRVTDPYSVALTLDSTHSVLVDLDDRRFRPRQWQRARQPRVEPVDQTIYELHVRDFSITDESVRPERRGTYLAFAERRSAGREHLRDLAAAGLTTVHLLPTFDIATIPEDRSAQAGPPCDLPALTAEDPAGEAQQACVEQVRDDDGFNWGYDPLHWSAPEGSYAVDAHGGARVREFRTMVGALHRDGLQVVLDQVFNHTAASGQDPRSVLDRVVPGYYHRLDAEGRVETSTCCQNVATEHTMAEKMMVDSVVTWARDYKVDGFRFDLMGHHSVQTMLRVREALDALTPRRDGVDGSRVYLYGEGWNFGEVADDRLFEQARQGNLGGTGIGTFSDRLRDAVRGGGPFDENPRVQGFGSGLYTDPNGDEAANGDAAAQLARLRHESDWVRLGLAGNLADFRFRTASGEVESGAEIDYKGQPAGYAEQPEEIITYVDKHDNETLFDVLTMKLPQDTAMTDRVRMNTLSLATTALAQTPVFWHAGTDLLRSKSLDRNSYDSGDWFNAVDWTGRDNGFGRGLPRAADNEAKWPFHRPLLADPALEPGPEHIAEASAQARDLLRLRFSTELFRLGDADLVQQKVSFPLAGPDAAPGVVTMHVDDTVGRDVDRRLDGVLVVLNASDEEVTLTVPGLAGHDLRLSAVQRRGADDVVRRTTWSAADGSVTVPARTVAVLVDPEGRGHGRPPS